MSSLNDVSSFNMERVITIKGTIENMSRAEGMISAKLRQSYESDLQAMAVSFRHKFHFKINGKSNQLMLASKYDVPRPSSHGHDVHGGHGILSLGEGYASSRCCRNVSTRSGALRTRRTGRCRRRGGRCLSSWHGPTYWLSTGNKRLN